MTWSTWSPEAKAILDGTPRQYRDDWFEGDFEFAKAQALLLIADRLANLAVTVDYIDRTLNDRLMGLTEAVGHLRDGLDEIDRTLQRGQIRTL